ncbi:MAG: SpoIID/LytB domain-containing protein [Candidatus Limiplasma sp.]|nr:SpoIID/LytB domain-containing protein [Candidatus Limiplasma sp.]
MRKRKLGLLLALCAALALAVQGCAGTAETIPPGAQPGATPGNANKDAVRWPQEKMKMNPDGIPTLSVYVVDEKRVREVDVETYVQGVLAGEMKNDWPMEALKAQAILARTFVLKFVQEKKSQYEGADISTDVEEAQAYDAKAVDERIKQAVKETSGVVLSSQGELPYTWFHAHSGGMTALAKEGLNWNKEEPPYTRVIESLEPAPDQVEDTQELAQAEAWEASFSLDDFQAACQKQNQKIKVAKDSKLAIGDKGDSGRAVTLTVDGQDVNAADLRIALGSTKMRSTLLTDLSMKEGRVAMAGKGYGHGVGMSQWGAYGMAAQGKKAKEIIRHYFQQVEVVKLW